MRAPGTLLPDTRDELPYVLRGTRKVACSQVVEQHMGCRMMIQWGMG